MPNEMLQRAILDALAKVTHPETGETILDGGQVQNVVADVGGDVRFSFTLRPEDPGSLVKAARTAAEGVQGVTSVKVNVQLPQTGQAAGGKAEGGLKPGSVPAPTPKPGILAHVGHVLAVSSGRVGWGSP